MIAWHELIGRLPFEWAHYAFMRNALLAVLLLAPLYAALGGMVVNRRMAFFSEAIGHSALTGVAIGTLAGLADPLGAMLPFAALLAGGISWIRRHSSVPSDSVIGLVMAFTMSLGVVILSRGGSFARYAAYLVGDILTLAPRDLALLAALLPAVGILWAGWYNRFLLAGLNPPLAVSRGLRVGALDTAFSVVVALVVTLSIRWVGLLVVNALLILPAAAARNLARRASAYLVWALAISGASGVLGLVTSYYANTAAGATIVLFAMAFFALTLAARRP